MNQQRARRFKSAQEAMERQEKLRAKGNEVQDAFDSNCITPGEIIYYLWINNESNQITHFISFHSFIH